MTEEKSVRINKDSKLYLLKDDDLKDMTLPVRKASKLKK